MNNRPSSVTAAPTFTIHRVGLNQTATVGKKGVECIRAIVTESNDSRVLKGTEILIADAEPRASDSVRYFRGDDAKTCRLITSRKKRVEQHEMLVMGRSIEVIASHPESGWRGKRGAASTRLTQTIHGHFAGDGKLSKRAYYREFIPDTACVAGGCGEKIIRVYANTESTQKEIADVRTRKYCELVDVTLGGKKRIAATFTPSSRIKY